MLNVALPNVTARQRLATASIFNHKVTLLQVWTDLLPNDQLVGIGIGTEACNQVSTDLKETSVSAYQPCLNANRRSLNVVS